MQIAMSRNALHYLRRCAAPAALSLMGLLGAGGAWAQQADAPASAVLTPPAAAAAAAEEEVTPSPPVRPQVPFASAVDEVVVYGRRDPLDLPDSVRSSIWRDQRRQMEAMMLERERMSSNIARDGHEALLGNKRVGLLPAYDPTQERQIDYGVNDSTPTGVINIFGGSFGRRDK